MTKSVLKKSEKIRKEQKELIRSLKGQLKERKENHE
jgi:hypothetical protein